MRYGFGSQWLSRTPCWWTYCPVIMHARAGRQDGPFVMHAEKSTPSAAIRSMFGVGTTGLPAAPIASHRSWSTKM